MSVADSFDLPEPVSLVTRQIVSMPALPVSITTLVGRDAEIAELSALVDSPDVRLVTLTGPGGIGKTRLSLEVARRASLAAFVSLASVTDPDLLAGAIETQLGIESDIGRSSVDNLARVFQGRTLLLLLDNLEHLLDGTTVISELLAACPELTVLSTSRIRLGLSGEHVVPLDPLETPPADSSIELGSAPESASVQLFVDRAQATHPAFALTKWNIDAVRLICRQLDGLPLAVELAAARSNILSPESLASRLEHRLELLTGGPRDVPRRLQTMRAAIEWSYELLPESERIFWEQLAVFRGGFTADAAIAVGLAEASQDLDPLTSLESLIGQGLLRTTTSKLGEPRFVMLETTREFALQQLEARGTADQARLAHALHFRSYAAQAEPFLMSSDPELWFSRIDIDLDNIRSALTWCRVSGSVALALEIASHLAWFWTYPNYLREGLDWFETLLACNSTEVSETSRALALLVAGDLAAWLVQVDKAVAMQEEALGIWRTVGDLQKTASTLRGLGNSAIDQFEYERAADMLQEARDLARTTGDFWNGAAAASLLGVNAGFQGRHLDAITHFTDALHEWQRTGHTEHLCSSLNGLGAAYLGTGDLSRSYESYEAAIGAAAADETNELAMSILGFGRIAKATGYPAIAVQLIAASKYLRERLGTAPRPQTSVLYSTLLAELRQTLGPATFASAFQVGQSLDLPTAVGLARQIPVPPSVSDGILSSRERDVLALLVEGASDTEIADGLFISRRTASKHVASILDKLGVGNRTAAVTAAHRRGLI
jgi:predicted ATPase/DNA-binding CsgD family transcriptional regulator